MKTLGNARLAACLVLTATPAACAAPQDDRGDAASAAVSEADRNLPGQIAFPAGTLAGSQKLSGRVVCNPQSGKSCNARAKISIDNISKFDGFHASGIKCTDAMPKDEVVETTDPSDEMYGIPATIPTGYESFALARLSVRNVDTGTIEQHDVKASARCWKSGSELIFDVTTRLNAVSGEVSQGIYELALELAPKFVGGFTYDSIALGFEGNGTAKDEESFKGPLTDQAPARGKVLNCFPTTTCVPYATATYPGGYDNFAVAATPIALAELKKQGLTSGTTDVPVAVVWFADSKVTKVVASGEIKVRLTCDASGRCANATPGEFIIPAIEATLEAGFYYARVERHPLFGKIDVPVSGALGLKAN